MPKDEKLLEKIISPEVQQLQELYEIMVEKGLDAVELKEEDFRVKLTRRFAGPPPAVRAVSSPKSEVQTPSNETTLDLGSGTSDAQVIPTPLAGVFYRASSPTSPPFVKDGDTVDPGQTLCIIEAMKVMNEIKAESRCRIVKILAENGRTVTAGQPLFQFEPA